MGQVTGDVRAYLELTTAMRRLHVPTGVQAWTYCGAEDLVLQHGTRWTETRPARLPPSTYVFPNACFYNAYRLARARKSLRYVEGYAASVFPMYHAWCITDDGIVVDPTWETYSRVSTEYLGVPIPLDVAARVRSSSCLSVLDNYRAQWPILRRPYDVDRMSARLAKKDVDTLAGC